MRTIFVHGGRSDRLATVVDELLTKLLRKFVSLAFTRVAMVDMILHVSNERRVGSVDNGDTAGSDIPVDSGETSKNDVVEHEEGVLTDPIPRGVEMARLQRFEYGLDALNVQVTVLLSDVVEFGLKNQIVRSLVVVQSVAGTRVLIEIAEVELHLLLSELILLSLELQELLAIHHCTT